MRHKKTLIVMLAAALLCSFANDTAQAGNFPFGERQVVVPASPAVARALVADFNFDGYPDFVLQNASTHQTIPVGWSLVAQ